MVKQCFRKAKSVGSIPTVGSTICAKINKMRRYRSAYKPRSVKKLEQKVRNRILGAILIIFLVGYVFINWGLPAFIGSLSIFNKTKHSTTGNNLIEDPAIAPPVLNIPFESTNSAQLKISGYSTPKSKVEIYLDDELKTTVTTDEFGSFTSEFLTLSEGTNNIYGRSINEDQVSNASDKKSLPSKTIKLLFSNEKPVLEISEPEDNKQIKGGDKKVHINGKTDAQNSVMVNGITVIVNNDGNFSTDVSINEGDNNISITAQNTVGNITKIDRKVNFSPE